MKTRYLAWLFLAALCCERVRAQDGHLIRMVVQRDKSPLVSFRILFMTGSASDPKGKEGIASLTAAMLAKGGTRTMPYEEIVKELYPMAATFEWQSDKEMTVFVGATHADNLPRYYGIIQKMLLEPGFRDDDFKRLRTDAIDYLKVSLRDGNDEELAKEELYNVIFTDHPYGHENMGRVSALEKMTLDDVRDFYRRNYLQGNLLVGLAGDLPADFENKVRSDFAKLPSGVGAPRFTAPTVLPGWQIEVIERETRSTAISIGFPISVRRGDKDWPALTLAASFLGQHRSSNGELYQRLRELRGLNYGDYAYIEYFPRGMFQLQPDPNLGRQQQIFQLWIRPVEPMNGLFAMRAALYELNKLVANGLSQEQFDATRDFLSKYAAVLTQTQDAQLGYALDSQYYGISEFNRYLKGELAKLTLAQVNVAIKRNLQSNRLRFVIVTKDATAFRDGLLSGKPSPIIYNSPKPEAVLQEDKVIEVFPVPIKADAIRIIPVEQVFR